MNDFIFPDIVKSFYTNMIYKDGVISSTVKGTYFEFNCELLGTTLDIPSEGLEFTMHKTLPIQNYEKKREFYFCIGRKLEHEIFQKRKKRTGGKLHDRTFWSAGNLFIYDRLLHYFLNYIVVPRFSNHSTITGTKMQILFAMKHGVPINWDYMILEHMATYDENSQELLNVFFFTKNLQHFEVNLVKEDPIPMEDWEIIVHLCNNKMSVPYNYKDKNI